MRRKPDRARWPADVAVIGLMLSATCTFPQVAINEVMYDPAGSEHHEEFVELVNLDQVSPVDLRGWRIGDRGELDELVDAGDGTILGPAQLALVLDGSYFGNSTAYEHVPRDAILLTIDDNAFGRSGWSNSSEETVLLENPAGETIDQFTYSPRSQPGFSWERTDSTSARPVWDLAYITGGTPAAQNSRASIFLPPRLELEAEPNPFVGELTIRLALPARTAVANIWLFDTEGSRIREIATGEDILSHSEFVWNGKDKNGRSVVPGPYVVYVEANIDGVVQQKKIVVVRGVR